MKKRDLIKKVVYAVLIVGSTVVVAYYSKDLGVVL